ncbi:TIGR04141 family sporadically distributed protein [Verrucosispora sp. WMMA2121]|uniref:DUF6119 family protein n=1 Tax=Verrucosispora sp. WMMA2121 TaxID=3015164 RepID=UPI0022B73B7F|nr:DUF6119 family protein [Verrucosispora sp. WMMA2121]MCZ7422945.1 TIGR04141 family sporadically distributed protein [Verrucosispora sp. WMMA2121]
MRSATNRTLAVSSTRPTNRKDRRRPDPHQPALFDSPVPPATPGTHPTTVYRLRVSPTPDGLREALNLRYLNDNGFEPVPRYVAGAPALLVHGSVPRPRAEWCDILAGLTGEEVDLGYSSGGGALLLVVDERAYALAYGTLGRHMVDQEAIDRTFGVSFAVRALMPSDIRQVRRRMVGANGRVDRSFVPAGQPIWKYGIDKWGEIVGQVGGRTENMRLSVCRQSGKPTRINGGDALHIHLCVEPGGLLADLREIERVCQEETPPADLEFITQIRPVPPSDPRMTQLHDILDERLALTDPPALGLAVPGELVGDIEHVGSYRIQVPKSGRRATLTDELDLPAILAHTNAALNGDRWDGLRNGTLTLYADASGNDEMQSGRLYRWITAEVAVGTSQLLLHEGNWYEIGERHRDFLRREIAEILARPSDITLPPWTVELEDEDSYNRAAAGSDPGLILLDKKLLRTEQHARGIEACDLLGPRGELIHVKRAKSSSPLSHLFAQGIVSYEALRYQTDARAKFLDVVRQQPNGRDLGQDFRPSKVVYAIALGGSRTVTVDSLFTFAQVALYQAMKALRNEGVDVEIIAIPPE